MHRPIPYDGMALPPINTALLGRVATELATLPRSARHVAPIARPADAFFFPEVTRATPALPNTGRYGATRASVPVVVAGTLGPEPGTPAGATVVAAGGVRLAPVAVPRPRRMTRHSRALLDAAPEQLSRVAYELALRADEKGLLSYAEFVDAMRAHDVPLPVARNAFILLRSKEGSRVRRAAPTQLSIAAQTMGRGGDGDDGVALHTTVELLDDGGAAALSMADLIPRDTATGRGEHPSGHASMAMVLSVLDELLRGGAQGALVVESCFALFNTAGTDKIEKVSLDQLRRQQTLHPPRTPRMVVELTRLIRAQPRYPGDTRGFVSWDEFHGAMTSDADPLGRDLVAAFLPVLLRTILDNEGLRMALWAAQ